MDEQRESGADLIVALRAIHDDMTDEGMCPYFRRGEDGQDPEGICSFGCRDEPACQTCWESPGWPSERLRDLIGRLKTTGCPPLRSAGTTDGGGSDG